LLISTNEFYFVFLALSIEILVALRHDVFILKKRSSRRKKKKERTKTTSWKKSNDIEEK